MTYGHVKLVTGYRVSFYSISMAERSTSQHTWRTNEAPVSKQHESYRYNIHNEKVLTFISIFQSTGYCPHVCLNTTWPVLHISNFLTTKIIPAIEQQVLCKTKITRFCNVIYETKLFMITAKTMHLLSPKYPYPCTYSVMPWQWMFFLIQKHYAVKAVCITSTVYCLQCFDTVGWAAGRASGL